MADAPTAAAVSIALLTDADEAEMRAFELDNRGFFARTIGDRGDAYFAGFAEQHGRLVAENRDGTSMLFAVRDRDSRVVGRVNIGEIHDRSGDLGYRIAEDACGRGYARTAVRLALEAAAARGIGRITAMTTPDNVASQRVLAANGFERLEDGDPADLEVAGQRFPAVHFARSLNA